jgi:hypothetical protein
MLMRLLNEYPLPDTEADADADTDVENPDNHDDMDLENAERLSVRVRILKVQEDE